MKQAIWLPFALLMLVASTTWAGDKNPKAEEGIQFNTSAWADVLKKAKAENRVIFLDAYASWCGPCKMLQKNVFTQKDVGDFFNKKFINVKIDMERGEGPMLSQRYPLEAYPTLFFINGNGKVIKKVIGYQTPEALLGIGKSVTGKDL